MDNFFAVVLDVTGGVARIDDEFGVLHDGFVIVAGVIGSDEDAVIRGEALGSERDGLHV